MKFKLFGTEIYISFLFSAVIAFMLATDRTGLVIPTLFAAFIHEGGHLFAMWLVEASPKEIRLIPASVQIVRGIPQKKCGEALISLFGPLSNGIVFGVLSVNYLVYGSEKSLEFAVLNLVIGVFNILPVNGLDGGTLLYLFISRNGNFLLADRIVRIITALLSVTALVVGIFLLVGGKFNISAFIVALYLLICAFMYKF